MAIQVGGLITDPDSLSYEIASYTATTTKEIVIDSTNKIIKLTQVGNLTRNGVTMKCLYSKLKEIWNTDFNLIVYTFPIVPITDEQYELVDDWNFDQTINPTTKITVGNISGSTSSLTITTVTGNFNANYIASGYTVSGSASIRGNTTVASVTSNNALVLSTSPLGTLTDATLTFNSGNDYTYNLIRTGGWAVKDSSGNLVEAWMNAITLGSMGAEGLTKTLTLTSSVSNSAVLTVNSTDGVVAGSFVAIPGALAGTRVSTVDSTTQLTITRPVTASSGTYLTIRPKDQVYYQISNIANASPTNAVLHGQINQAIQIYGNLTHGNIDYRTPAIAKFYVREQGYTYDAANISDIGITSLTYQTYRFSVSNKSDALQITHSDAEISSTGITADQDPYNNMRITWYTTPQPRSIGGSTYYFNVIIDANVQLSATNTTFSSVTAEQIYEFVQWSLRRPVGINIDAGATSVRTGTITRSLLEFVGDTLYTIYDLSDGGVYIDHFREEDINRIVFSDNTNRQFPYISFGRLTFGSHLIADGEDAVYKLFYNQINQGLQSIPHTDPYAVIVKSYSSDPSNDGTYEIKGNLHGNLSVVTFDFDWDNNTQCSWLANTAYYVGDEYRHKSDTIGLTNWYQVTTNYTSSSAWSLGTDGANATSISGPTVVLNTVGTYNGQYVTSTGTIEKSPTNLIDAAAQQENNYAAT